MKDSKKTKIIATIGPSIDNKPILKKLIRSGVDVFRINFSHGTHEEHQKSINLIKEINEERGLNIAILADLQGPKIRIGENVVENSFLKKGKKVTLTSKKCTSSENLISISYKALAKDVKKGDYLLLDDGKIKLRAEGKLDAHNISAKIIQGGKLLPKKGVNLPDSKISASSLTSKDKKDLDFILKHQIPWIALSFIRNKKDIIDLKNIVLNKNKYAKIIAKIEKPEALKQLEDIIAVSDGTMVARGDLGVEIPVHKVPLIQKNIIALCRKYSKPSIIATQLMESMLESTMPARSDVNDVANAVLDGTDALMLSGETSVGKYPIKVVETIVNIIKESEKDNSIYYHERLPNFNTKESRVVTDAVCYSSCRMAQRINASSIITMSFSGYTGFKISSFRPRTSIFVFTGNKSILNMLSLVWGVKAFYYDKFKSTDNTIEEIKNFLLKEKLVSRGKFIINITSIPISEKGESNMMKITKV